MNPVNSEPNMVQPVAASLGLARRSGLQDMANALRRKLESEKKNYHVLEKIFYGPLVIPRTKAYKHRIAEVFASPLYSDSCKKYFAAAHVDDELMFFAADRFLTEEIILSHVKGKTFVVLEWSYFKAMMGSIHLSERIMEATFERMAASWRREVLTLTPDTMITPKVMNSWLASVEGWYRKPEDSFKVAAPRIREAHPEYEGFPDDWVMKVFCGGEP